MSTEQTSPILRRMASVGKKEHQARAMTVAKAIRLSTAKIANEMFDLPMAVIGFVAARCEGADIAQHFDDQSLLIVLEGPEGAVGAAIVSADLVGGLIQQQTMGRVSAPMGEPRAMTRTDAAMCAPLLDALFKRVAPILEIKDERQMMTGYSFGARADDARALAMALDAQTYNVLQIKLDMAAGVRQGDIALILPFMTAEDAADKAKADKQDKDSAKPRATLNDAVLSLPADLNINLCHLHMPWQNISRLKVGEIVKLPHNSFPDIEIATCTGRVIGTGTVGQVDGLRALRLKRPPIHATQPRRRVSDADSLDLPNIQALPARTTRKGDTFESGGNSGFDMPDIDLGADAGITDFEGLPDLEDMPSMPDLAAPDDPAPAPLPELDGLPELDDFPDLADLPDLSNTG